LWRVCSVFAARKIATNIIFCDDLRESSQKTFSYGSTCHGAIVATKYIQLRLIGLLWRDLSPLKDWFLVVFLAQMIRWNSKTNLKVYSKTQTQGRGVWDRESSSQKHFRQLNSCIGGIQILKQGYGEI